MMRRWIACICTAMGILGLVSPACNAESLTIPELTICRRDLVMNEGLEFVQKMRLGWNLGNTFDAINDSFRGNDLNLESAWVGIKTTRAMIEAIHDAGFNTLRMPVSWHNHVDAEFTINGPWLDRVQEVVDWAIDLNMYVILNTHHDVLKTGGYYPDSEHFDSSARYIARIWEQLSERFKDYDEHLIFESMNEPRLKDTSYEWNFDAKSAACVDSLEVINKLNQLFVDTVRAGGGNNATRYLMVPSYAAAPYNAVNGLFRLPTDEADNRIILSVHAYTPYAFALQEGGVNTFNYKGNQASEIGLFMNSLYDNYITQGIPVVIGEFGARDKDGNTQARVDYASDYIALASARGITCCWWDNHAFKGNGELFGLFDRRNLVWPYPEIVEGMVRYAGYEKLPVFKP